MTETPGPRSVEPRAALQWLLYAFRQLMRYPGRFLAAALLAPALSMLLLALPVWEFLSVRLGPWFSVLATVICYGLPSCLAVNFACAMARAVELQRPVTLRQLAVTSTWKVLLRPTLFSFGLLLQGYLAVYLIHHLLSPDSLLAQMQGHDPRYDPTFGLAPTLLGTQLGMCGGLLLVLQFLFAGFVVPLYLFRETPFYLAWRRSFFAMQLNPWLAPALGVPGFALVILASLESLSAPVQVLAVPLPALLGVLLFAAWRDIFQGGEEQEDEVEVPEQAALS